MFTDLERRLCKALCDHPAQHANRYTADAEHALLEILFRSLTNDRQDYLSELFPSGFPPSYKLQEAQGIEECAEYTAAAKGRPCGHIFKQGEGSYHCMTCTDDNTCVLCARCFDSSDHEGHQFTISISGGNSGCCDCGDLEAWKRPVNCAMHTATGDHAHEEQQQQSILPEDLQSSIRTTIGRVLDYFCDVISCSPENLRSPKTMESITHDAEYSRLGSKYYDKGDAYDPEPEFCLILWNDEKHTVQEVEDQVTRACHKRRNFGRVKAQEADEIGRTVLEHSRDLKELIHKATIIEQIKVTVTIRSSRDTFRERMCGTIVEWLSDIAKCSVGNDHHILRHTVCEEMLQQWRIGSEAYNARVGKDGIEDHEKSEAERLRQMEAFSFMPRGFVQRRRRVVARPRTNITDLIPLPQIITVGANAEPVINAEVEEEDDDDEDEEEEEDDEDEATSHDGIAPEDDDEMEVEEAEEADDADLEATESNEDRMDTDLDEAIIDIEEATIAGYPPPLPRPERRTGQAPSAQMTPTESESGDEDALPDDQTRNYMNVPKTPNNKAKRRGPLSRHWSIRPAGYSVDKRDVPAYEDLMKNIRLDSMILFDLRLWKQTRIQLRDLYISTVVNVPQFKRILGLRFSGLYTTLSQLYLIADREPDHSIINLSLQMLTSPTITEEIMERGNFLTNLMAILYTFLTTRQVGFPRDVSTSATLAFDAGSVTNRRLYHFLTDLRYFLASEFVQRKVRTEEHYLLQFLDLAKLCQGICPNVRAVGEHVEYETDAWISASLLTREINKLCRQFAESYDSSLPKQPLQTSTTLQAIYDAGYTTIITSVGFERQRFEQSEIKDLVRFKTVLHKYRIVDFVVEKGSISFHHALHYTLSWLLESGKTTSDAISRLRAASQRFIDDNKSSPYVRSTYQNIDDPLLALFDYPLRVCAWLAQMKAGMWVRNGMSLRHQMGQYKGVTQRDVGYHRDLVMLQTALVTCEPDRVLASMLERYALIEWMEDDFKTPTGYEDTQILDIAEDFVQIMIVLLTDRASLMPRDEMSDPQLLAVRKDIIHTLCFKPLSFSDLSTKLTERTQETGGFQQLLEEMTNFRPPEGLHDSGLFELKPEHLVELDPYNANFSKNQRDEAENIYKTWKAKGFNKSPDDIVLEPQLLTIAGGAYQDLAEVTSTLLFAHMINRMLSYAMRSNDIAPEIPATRVEAFLQVVLQLLLIATLEDDSDWDDLERAPHAAPSNSFVRLALHNPYLEHIGQPVNGTIVGVLHQISNHEAYAPCRAKIKHILRLFVRKREFEFKSATAHLEFPFGRLDTASPANVENEIELRKKQALERKAKVMAQFQAQQQSFLDNQGATDWGEDDISDSETVLPQAETHTWKYPDGVCIQCREECNDSRIYGTFAMLVDSNVLRQTDAANPDWANEALRCPQSLDQSLHDVRPYGVSGDNHEQVRRINAECKEFVTDRQGLGKGWPKKAVMRGPVSVGCGHIMHFTCFENYYQSVIRRQQHQIARNHPERILQKEFVCPLCKALGNAFLPIIWKGEDESYPGKLSTAQDFDEFLEFSLSSMVSLRADFMSNDSLGMDTHLAALEHFSAVDINRIINLRNSESEMPNSPAGQAVLERPELAPFAELSRIYTRLKETLHIAKSANSPETVPASKSFDHVDVLLETLARTVTATEIAYRGQESEEANTLLSRIPQQTLTHMRILSSTARSYGAFDAITVLPASESHVKAVETTLFRQLLLPSVHREFQPILGIPAPLLLQDSFSVLAQASLVLCPTVKVDIKHTIQLCYIAEIIRVVVVYLCNPGTVLQAVHRRSYADQPSVAPAQIAAVRELLEWVMKSLTMSNDSLGILGASFIHIFEESWPDLPFAALYRLLQSYSLAFLRKTAILMHVSHGVIFPPLTSTDVHRSELDRLTWWLKLPHLNDVLPALGEFSGNSQLKKLTGSWLHHLVAYNNQRSSSTPSFNFAGEVKLLHPCPLELIGLPKYFDVLMEETHRRKCPTTAKDLTDPSICLFCGDIFCSQAVCCMSADRKRGGCNVHVEKCSSPIGLFLNIRKCMVLFLHVVPPKPGGQGPGGVQQGQGYPANGSWFNAPYLTKHGETDAGMRMRSQLILNQRRYDRLIRESWLMVNGSVWSAVARKLESEVNGGGWESI